MEHAHSSLTSGNLPFSTLDLLEMLKKQDISYALHHHAPIFTVEEGADLKAAIPGTHCRNLFLRDKKEKMFLVVAANETAIDLKKLEVINHIDVGGGPDGLAWAVRP